MRVPTVDVVETVIAKMAQRRLRLWMQQVCWCCRVTMTLPLPRPISAVEALVSEGIEGLYFTTGWGEKNIFEAKVHGCFFLDKSLTNPRAYTTYLWWSYKPKICWISYSWVEVTWGEPNGVGWKNLLRTNGFKKEAWKLLGMQNIGGGHGFMDMGLMLAKISKGPIYHGAKYNIKVSCGNPDIQ